MLKILSQYGLEALVKWVMISAVNFLYNAMTHKYHCLVQCWANWTNKHLVDPRPWNSLLVVVHTIAGSGQSVSMLQVFWNANNRHTRGVVHQSNTYHMYNGGGPQVLVNTLRLRKNGRHFPNNIFICIFLDENVWISIKIHWSLFLGVQLTIFQHWFR